MSYAVDFNDVSTVGLESSPVAAALAGLRAHEARYFKNKYDHVFTVEPASSAKTTIDWVHRILKEERDIVISSRPLEATALPGREHPNRLRLLRERSVDQRDVHRRRPQEAGGRVQALRRDGSPRGARLAVQVREAEVEAGRNHSRFLLHLQERLLTAGGELGRDLVGAEDLEVLADEDVVRPVDADVVDLVLAVAQLHNAVDDAARVGGQCSLGRLVGGRSADDRPGSLAVVGWDLTDLL